MKKTCLVLAALLFAAICFGCGGQRPYDPENFIEDVTNPQIVKEPVTLKVLVPKNQSIHGDYSKMALFTEATRITNIQFDFIEVDMGAMQDKRALAWEGNRRDMPDLFLFGNNVAEQVQLASKNAIWNIDDLMYLAPNYSALMEEQPEIRTAATLPDGKMYSFVDINDVPRDLTFKMFINTKILKKTQFGERLPETLPEFKEALIAMSNTFSGADKKNFVPLSSVKLGYVRNFIMSAFGYVGTGIELKHDGSNKITYVPLEKEYKAYIQYLNELYREGLLDKNVFEKTDQKLTQLGETGMLGAFDGSADFAVVGEEKAEDYSAIGPLTSGGYGGIDNSEKRWLSFSGFKPTVCMIPKISPYRKEIVRLMDFFYSDYGIQLQSFGIEGTHFTWDDEEMTSFTFNVPDGMRLEQYRGTITPNAGTGAAFYWKKDFITKQNDPLLDRVNGQAEAYQPYFTEAFPENQVKFTEEELIEIADLQRGLDDYMATFEINYIKGTDGADINADWDEHLNTLKMLKVDRLIELYQAAYNRYLAA